MAPEICLLVHTSYILLLLFIWLCWVLIAALGIFTVECGILFPGSNPGPQHWGCRVLATGPPGKSLPLLNCRQNCEHDRMLVLWLGYIIRQKGWACWCHDMPGYIRLWQERVSPAGLEAVSCHVEKGQWRRRHWQEADSNFQEPRAVRPESQQEYRDLST